MYIYIYVHLNPLPVPFRLLAERILRYTGVLAALGSVVPGILRSCSGYAGFWPWLLAAGRRADAK